MGTELLVGLALAAAGTGTQMYYQDKANKERDRVAAQGIQEQAQKQEEADKRINQEIGALEGSSPEAERAKAMQQFTQQLRRNRSSMDGGAAPLGASDQYQADMKQTAGQVEDYGQRVAGTMARISAPMRQRQNEGVGFGRAGADVNAIARSAGASDFLNRLRMQGIRPNPWGMAAGQMMSAAGGSYASSGTGAEKGDMGEYDPNENGGYVTYPLSKKGR